MKKKIIIPLYIAVACGALLAEKPRFIESFLNREASAVALLSLVDSSVIGASENWRQIPTGRTEAINDLAVAGDGGIVTTGYSDARAFRNYDYRTLRYASDGSVARDTVLDTGGMKDKAYGMAIVSENGTEAIYVTGDRNGAYLTVKYDAAGNEIWRREFDSPDYDSARAVAHDADAGRIYVTGHSGGRFHTIAYSLSGDALWTAESSGVDEYAEDIAVDSAGSVIVAGRVNNTALVIKYDAAGDEIWRLLGRGIDRAHAVATDGSDIIVAGKRNGNQWIARYDSAGNLLWEKFHDGGGDDASHSVAINEHGVIAVVGESDGSGQILFYGADGLQRPCLRELL